jgi:ABC-type glycerol-3-phosphate transport system permease component
MELEITWNRAVRVWWSYLWRNLIAIVVATIIGMIVCAVIGFILETMGFSVRTIQIIVAPSGFVIGLAISIVPLKMILGKDFGEFRLVLLAKQPPTAPPSSTPRVIK